MIKHINEVTFKGDSPWVKAMNKASEHWKNYCDDTLSDEEQKKAFLQWQDIRFQIETGCFGNNS